MKKIIVFICVILCGITLSSCSPEIAKITKIYPPKESIADTIMRNQDGPVKIKELLKLKMGNDINIFSYEIKPKAGIAATDYYYSPNNNFHVSNGVTSIGVDTNDLFYARGIVYIKDSEKMLITSKRLELEGYYILVNRDGSLGTGSHGRPFACDSNGNEINHSFLSYYKDSYSTSRGIDFNKYRFDSQKNKLDIKKYYHKKNSITYDFNDQIVKQDLDESTSINFDNYKLDIASIDTSSIEYIISKSPNPKPTKGISGESILAISQERLAMATEKQAQAVNEQNALQKTYIWYAIASVLASIIFVALIL